MKLKEDVRYKKTFDDENYEKYSIKQLINNVNYTRFLYIDQKNGCDEKIIQCKNKMRVRIVLFVVVLFAEVFMYKLSDYKNVNVLTAIEMVLFFTVLASFGVTMINSIVNYSLHIERKRFKNDIERKGIYTVTRERKHCGRMIAKGEELLEALQSFDISPEEKKKELLENANDYNLYSEYRADERVYYSIIVRVYFYHLMFMIVESLAFLFLIVRVR